MKKNNLILSSIIFSILLISFVSADNIFFLGCFKQNSIVNLPQSCTNCTYSNISSVTYPNSSIAVSNISMTQVSNKYFIYPFILSSNLGLHVGDGSLDQNDAQGPIKRFTYSFLITKDGNCPDTSSGINYLILTSAVFILFGLGLYFSITIPYHNLRDPEGKRVQIVKIKYIKLFVIMITYSLFSWLINILLSMSNNFLGFANFSGFLNGIFRIIISASYPFITIIFVLIIYNFFKDINLKKQMEDMGRVFEEQAR